MGDTRGASIGGAPTKGAPTKAQLSIENLLGALAVLMEQKRVSPIGGYESTKALKGIVDKIGWFDGKNVLMIFHSKVFSTPQRYI